MLDLEKVEKSRLEAVSLKDLSKIGIEAKKIGIDLILIGGYAVRAYTTQRSWRFTKDMDFITTRKDLTALHGVFKLLGYSFEKTEFGVKGSRKVDKGSIELHVSVDKVIDQSTGKEYPLASDIFSESKEMGIEPSYEENKEMGTVMLVAPIEDVVLMKLMTERPRDHFDAIAMTIDSFDRISPKRFARICAESELNSHIKARLESVLADTKKGLIKKSWKEFTAREFIREQEIKLKDAISKLHILL